MFLWFSIWGYYIIFYAIGLIIYILMFRALCFTVYGLSFYALELWF